MFLAGLLFIGAPYAVGYEIDEKYLRIACEAIDEKLDEPVYDVVLADIGQLPLPNRPIFDIVVTNPPFGTKEAGIDMKFLEFACRSCRGSVYSFHKTSTIDYVRNRAESWGYSMKIINTVQFPLPKRFAVVAEAVVHTRRLAIAFRVVATHNRASVVVGLPVVISLALTGVVLDVDAVAVRVFIALKPIDTLVIIGAPYVVDVAIATANVAIGTIAVSVIAAVERAPIKVAVPYEFPVTVAAFCISVRSVTVGIERAGELAHKYCLVPAIGGTADAKGSVDVLTGAMGVKSAVHEAIAPQLSNIPAVALVAVACVHVQINVGAVAVRVLTAVEVAVLILPNVLRIALASTSIYVLLRSAPPDIGTVEVAQLLVRVP
ncbi:unnamed protein product [Sphagnum balticum]